MKLKKGIVIPVVWVILSFITYGFLYADRISRYANPSEERKREVMAECCLFALVPPMWVASPFLTGFYYHGWRLK